jgi:STE24 endopeptidase
MAQLLVIGVFLVLLLHDAAPVPAARVEGLGGDASVAGMTIGALAGIWLVTQIFVWRCTKEIDRSGSVRLAWMAERFVGVSRFVAAGIHAFAVLGLGWLVVVRDLVGDLVLVDELLAVLPVLCVFVGGWASLYGIDRRMREAVVVRSLDEGLPIQAYVSFGAHVMSFVRHQMALIGLPVVMVMGWSETVQMSFARWWVIATQEDAGVRAIAQTGVQVGGALVIFAIVPLLMRYVWHTRPLEAGSLRDELLELCRAHRVRVRELLVWNTHGVMVNGAVMGLVGWMRYVLLSDGLLSGLSREQVEAVAAHEVGHIRRHHIPWLAGAVVSTLMLVALGVDWITLGLVGHRVEEGWQLWAVGGVVLATAALTFGWVSRRFEWQADAFAAQHLSGHRRGGRGVVSPDGVAAMVGALGAVARLNHIPRKAPSFRHGSIATRQRKLMYLVGQRADRLAIDRQVARMKVAIGLGVLATIGLVGFDAVRVLMG